VLFAFLVAGLAFILLSAGRIISPGRTVPAFEAQVRAFAAVHGERAPKGFKIETVCGLDSSAAFLSAWEKRLDTAASAAAFAAAPSGADTGESAAESGSVEESGSLSAERLAAIQAANEEVEQAKANLRFAHEAANIANGVIKRVQLQEEMAEMLKLSKQG
jgi:hypothetical protein